MKVNEVLDLINTGKEYVFTTEYFSYKEFLYCKNYKLYDEGGYVWTLSDLESLPESDWSMWIDLDNLESPNIKQERNKLCQCGSGIKFKKCCLITKPVKLKIQDKKLRKVDKVKKAIEQNLSVYEMKIKNREGFNGAMRVLSDLTKEDNIFKITKRGRV